MATYEIKGLNAGGVLDHAILLFKNHFGVIAGIVGCLMLPILLAQGILVELTMGNVSPFLPQEPPSFDIIFKLYATLLVPSLVLWLFAMPLTYVALTYATAMGYVGKEVKLGGCFRLAFGDYLRALGLFIVQGILTNIGYMLCLIPGLILLCLWTIALPVMVLEKTGPIDALRRSARLMTGEKGQWALLFEAFILTMIVGIIGMMAGILPQIVPIPFVGMAVANIVAAALMGFQAAVWTVFYFSTRCRVEHMDLDLLADAVAAEAAAEPVL